MISKVTFIRPSRAVMESSRISTIKIPGSGQLPEIRIPRCFPGCRSRVTWRYSKWNEGSSIRIDKMTTTTKTWYIMTTTTDAKITKKKTATTISKATRQHNKKILQQGNTTKKILQESPSGDLQGNSQQLVHHISQFSPCKQENLKVFFVSVQNLEGEWMNENVQTEV